MEKDAANVVKEGRRLILKYLLVASRREVLFEPHRKAQLMKVSITDERESGSTTFDDYVMREVSVRKQ